MWQNVSKISPLFCGKIFEIFCHGLPAGGGQLFRTSTIFLPLLTPTFRRTPVNDNRHCVKFCCLRKSNSSMLCIRYQLGLSLISRMLSAVIPACVLWRLVLLPLRHVHLVHQVHQVHPAKCFVTKTCASALIAHRVSGSGCLQGLIASPCSAVSPKGKTALSRLATVCPRGNDNRKALRFSFPS